MNHLFHETTKNTNVNSDQTVSGPVRATLTFIRSQADKPTFYSQAYTGDKPRYLFEVENIEVNIADIRRQSNDLSLDREGFMLLSEPTEPLNLYDDEVVQTCYFSEVRALLKAALGAEEVAIFDATRRSDSGGGAANQDGKRAAATRIHVDYTASSGPARARDVLGDERFNRLLAVGARIVQVNIWRPIRGPVRRTPLALADASTIKYEDLVATDQVFPDRIGEIYHLAHDPAQRWYYVPEMTSDEVLLIKGWDSLSDGRARFTPHTAFQLPEQDDTAPPRESIEVRTFVVIR